MQRVTGTLLAPGCLFATCPECGTLNGPTAAVTSTLKMEIRNLLNPKRLQLFMCRQCESLFLVRNDCPGRFRDLL